MERIAAIGLTLHEADVQALERISSPAVSGGQAFLRELADSLAASELVLIATCNRVEVVFARESGHLPCAEDLRTLADVIGLAAGDPLREELHLHTGPSAVRHLFRVTASLDSLLVGEDQILTQVRAAFREAESAGLSGRLLGPVFEHAFQVGKQVRTQTELGRHPLSIVGVGLAMVAERFTARTPRIALIGAGSTGTLAARTADDAGLEVALVVNRSIEAAQRLADLYGARAMTLADFLRAPEHVDAIVSATSAPGFVLERPVLLALAERGPLVCVDLAVPRDVEPLDDDRIECIGLEHLRARAAENRRKRRSAVTQAEALVEAKLGTLARRFSKRRLTTVLADLHQESRDVLERELTQLFTGRLGELGADERRAVERWARGAFGRMSHVPISALKRLADEIAGEAS